MYHYNYKLYTHAHTEELNMSRERFRSVVKNISKIFARVDEQ